MTSTTMELADVYAEAETSFWFGQEHENIKVYTNARRSRDEARAALEQRIKELEQDAKRLDWLRDTLFTHKWNGVVGSGCAVQWKVAPDYLFKQRDLSENSGIMVGDFRRAIDRAMSEAALKKAVDISQELGLP